MRAREHRIPLDEQSLLGGTIKKSVNGIPNRTLTGLPLTGVDTR